MTSPQIPADFTSQTKIQDKKAILSRVSGFLLVTGAVGTVVYVSLSFAFLSIIGISIPFNMYVQTLISFSAFALIVYVPALAISLFLVIKNRGRNIHELMLLALSILALIIGIIGIIEFISF